MSREFMFYKKMAPGGLGLTRLPWPHLKMIGQLPSRRFCRCGSHVPPGPAHQTCKVDRISARHENCQWLQAKRRNISILEVFLQISSLTCARLRQPSVSIRGDLLCEAAHSLGAALRITTFGNQHRQVILGKVLNLILKFILNLLVLDNFKHKFSSHVKSFRRGFICFWFPIIILPGSGQDAWSREEGRQAGAGSRSSFFLPLLCFSSCFDPS